VTTNLATIEDLLQNYDWCWASDPDTPDPSGPLKEALLQFAKVNHQTRRAALLALWEKYAEGRPFRLKRLRLAGDVPNGHWFAKVKDGYRYRRICDSSAKHHTMTYRGQDHTTLAFGMAPHGNLAAVPKDRIVWVSKKLMSPRFPAYISQDPFFGIL